MQYVIFERDDSGDGDIYVIDEPAEMLEAQWRMVDEGIDEMPVWVTPRTRAELLTVEGVDDYKNGQKLFQPEIKDKGPKHRIKVYNNGKITHNWECWLINEEFQPVKQNEVFYYLASIEDLHPKCSEHPDYYVENGVLYCNGSLVVGDWVLTTQTQ